MQMDGWSYGADKTQGLRVFLVPVACWRFNFHKFPILIQLFFWEKHSQNEQQKPTTSKCPTLFRVHSSTLHEAKQYFPCVLRSREKVFEKTNVKYSLPWAECCTRVCAFPKPITKNSRGSNLALRPKQKQWKVSVQHSKLKERRTSLQVLAIVRDQI